MRRIRYAGGTLVTSDEAAAALCDYAAELANAGRAAAIVIPALDEAGMRSDVEIVIGPASQVFSEPAESSGEEPPSQEFVTQVRDQTKRLTPNFPPVGGGFVDWDL
jgi:hypothetical protein